MVIEALLANAAILFGLALILGVFAPATIEGRTAWGAGILVLTGASWLQLAAPAGLANQIAAMAAAWGVWTALAARFAGAAPRSTRAVGMPMLQAILRAFGRAASLFVVASPVQYGIVQASSVEPVSGLSLVGLAVFALGFLLDVMRMRRSDGRRWGAAMVWWGLWIASASAGWWVAAWTAIGPILASWMALRRGDAR